MIRFNNDYNRAAHPKILEALSEHNSEAYGGYGIDPWCEKAEREIKKYLNCEKAQVHFLVGGTQANFTVIAAALRPYHSIISADTGHINVHETGAVENTGHKIETIPSKDGKITAEEIRAVAENYRTSGVKEHITKPKMVYISLPTEYGTVYSLKELEGIKSVCDEYGMYLFIDGARMGYALSCDRCDLKPSDLARLADVFYFGGTKCGALFGEAVVLTNDELFEDFRSYIKQNGAMLAKGWLLGLQFYTLFKDGLYFDIARKANAQAMRIKKAFEKREIPFFTDSPTNQQFVVLDDDKLKKLSEKFVFEYEGRLNADTHCVRFCTGWSTEDTEVDELVSEIEKL